MKIPSFLDTLLAGFNVKITHRTSFEKLQQDPPLKIFFNYVISSIYGMIPKSQLWKPKVTLCMRVLRQL